MKLSRRKFLTYVLGSTAGFLGASILFPMLRYMIDPLFKVNEEELYVDTGLDVTKITDIPIHVEFTVKRKDGWYKPQKGELMSAWVLKSGGTILALSPICKHLGCTVNWNSNPKYKGQFFCPCHFGRYTKEGINVPGTPPNKPLDRYKTKVIDGKLFIGPIIRI